MIMRDKSKNYSILKKQAVDLRVIHRYSLEKIATELNISQSTASKWLKEYPLTQEEIKERNILNGQMLAEHLKTSGSSLRFSQVDKNENTIVSKLSNNQTYSSNQKGKIAESAVILRLTLSKYDIYKSFFDGDKFDMLVANDNYKIIKLQVKWCGGAKNGQKYIKSRCSNGRNSARRYTKDELDFFIGYDIESDTCYIYPAEEKYLSKTYITVDSDHAERWDLLQTVDKHN